MAKQQRKGRRSTKGAKRPKRPAKSQGKKPLPPDAWAPGENLDQPGPQEWDWADESPSARAQEIVYEAFRAADPQQVALAHEALTICPDCADAYVLLAEHAPNLSEAIELYEEGVAAGRRALGPNAFRRHVGRFWEMLEARPYMRAKMRLAQCLLRAGRPEEGAEHLREMLRLDPADHQGARWVLAACLLELDDDDRLTRLLDRYDQDDSANWAYTHALLAFRREGDSQEAGRRLAAATRLNRHVPGYLLGDVPLPRRMPDYFSPGKEDEAICYAVDFLSGWKSTPGAISWLRKAAGVGLPKLDRRPKRVLPMAGSALEELPQVDDELWQADIRRMPGKIRIGGEKTRPWAILITNRSEDTIPAMEMFPERPSDEMLCRLLVHAMLEPSIGDPHRPKTIQFSTKRRRQAWQSELAKLDIECACCKPLEHVDHVVRQLQSLLPEGRDCLEDPDGQQATCDLTDLPQETATVWQADIFRLPTWVVADSKPTRPWIILVIDSNRELVLAHDLVNRQPNPDALWTKLCEAMRFPMPGGSCRPGAVQLRSEDHHRVVGPYLEEIGVRCVVSDELGPLDSAYDDMVKHTVGEPPIPAMVDVPGVSPAAVGRFFEAAARFHQKSPWRRVLGDTPIRVQCDKFNSGPWYAVVMGQSGMTLGLALYDDLGTLDMLLDGRLADEEGIRRTSVLSVTFDEEFNLAIADLEAAEQFGWPVATPEAYPCAVRVNPGRSVRPPLRWELELLEGCLRAVPEFLDDEPLRQRITVPVASGELELVISWPDKEAA